MTQLREGWARGADEDGIFAYHYFVGLSGIGGRFRSLCNQATVDAEVALTKFYIEPACAVCTAWVAEIAAATASEQLPEANGNPFQA